MKNFETNSKRMEIETGPVATSDYRGCFSSHFISISNMCKKLKEYQENTIAKVSSQQISQTAT